MRGFFLSEQDLYMCNSPIASFLTTSLTCISGFACGDTSFVELWAQFDSTWGREPDWFIVWVFGEWWVHSGLVLTPLVICHLLRVVGVQETQPLCVALRYLREQ